MAYGDLIFQMFSIVFLLLTIVFLLGIIWRVEMKLDVAYKIFLAAIIFLLLSQILNLLALDARWVVVTNYILEFLFSILFLSGALTMRSMLRDVDGEKTKNAE